MAKKSGFNKESFMGFFNDIVTACESMGAVMKETGDPRDAPVLKVMDLLGSVVNNLMDGVNSGQKILWQSGVFSPELFMAFENVTPFAMEVPIFMVSFMDPDGVGQYIDIAEQLGMPSDICGTDKGTLGFAIKEMLPPCDMCVMGSAPCDSVMAGHQVLEKVTGSPFAYLDMPELPDERGLDLLVHHLWKMIGAVEKELNTRLDWDKFKELIIKGNEMQEYLLEENELHKVKPCPHGGRLGTISAFLNFIGAGTQPGVDAAKFIYEDAKRLVDEGKGTVANERARLVWYYPDPLYDLGIHDWLEDEYSVCTVLTMFGHATCGLIDPSTPDTIMRDYAKKLMSFAMTRQFRGPMENYMDLFASVVDGFSPDCLVYPMVHQCKHSLGLQGVVRDYCKTKNLPLLMPDYDVIDNRIVSIETIRQRVADFLDEQVLPYK